MSKGARNRRIRMFAAKNVDRFNPVFWNELDTRFVEKVGEERVKQFFNLINDVYPASNYHELLYEYINIARDMAAIEAVNDFKAYLAELEHENHMLQKYGPEED